MDMTLENISAALYNGVLPQEWAILAPDTRKNLGGWIEHFEKRIQQYTNWVRYYSQHRFHDLLIYQKH